MSKRPIIVVGVALILVAVVLRFTVFGTTEEDHTVFASGTVEATEADLGFQAAGRIDQIGVREGDLILAGAELARLDQAEIAARKRAAEAQVAAARAQLNELIRGFRPEDVEALYHRLTSDELVEAQR